MTEDRIIDFVNSLSGKLKAETDGQILAEVLRLLVQIRDNTEETNKVLENIFWRMAGGPE